MTVCGSMRLISNQSNLIKVRYVRLISSVNEQRMFISMYLYLIILSALPLLLTWWDNFHTFVFGKHYVTIIQHCQRFGRHTCFRKVDSVKLLCVVFAENKRVGSSNHHESLRTFITNFWWDVFRDTYYTIFRFNNRIRNNN